MKRFIALIAILLIGNLIAAQTARADCTAGACVFAGPRLASFSSERGFITNAVVNGLLGSNVNLNVTDWNALGQGDISLLSYLNLLQANLGVSDTATVLTTPVTIAQLIAPAVTVAQADGNTAAVTALGKLTVPGLTNTIKLGDILSVGLPNGSLTTDKVNLLDLVTGVVQLYNYKNVATTNAPITISGANLGLGSTLTSVQLYFQIIEPPVFVCGPTGTQFHTAAIRVKLALDLVDLAPSATSLLGIGNIAGASVNIGNLDLYLEVAKATGIIDTVNAISNAVIVKATPGVAKLYLGTIADNVFWNRTRTITYADVSYGVIGSVSLTIDLLFPLVDVNLNLALNAKSYANGEAPFQNTLTFSGPYPQKKTASTSALFATNLTSSLMTNLDVSISDPLINAVLGTLLPVLKTIVAGALPAVLNPILSGVVDPLLEAIGVRLGEVDVVVSGVGYSCNISGYAYSDANHNSQREGTENGTGLTLYAKLIPSTSPTAATKVVAINTSSGTYTFTDVTGATYSVIVDTNNTLSDVTPGVNSGWIGTEAPTLARTGVTLSYADVLAQNFGLYNGSRLAGTVFNDIGNGGGTANNAAKDGSEAGLASITVKVTDNGGSITYDSVVTAGDGTYTLYIPAAAGTNTLKVSEVAAGGYVSTGGAAGTTSGTYSRTTDTVTFTNAVGSSYTGVNFADVPENTFAPDRQQTALPGAVVFYPHVFVSGSAGQVTFSSVQTVTPTMNGWGPVLYRDTNCNGAVDSGEAIVSAAITVAPGDNVCLVVRTVVPANAPLGSQHQATLTASYSYTNASPALNSSQSRTELTLVVEAAAAALKLSKVVDKSSAKSGDTLAYTITYRNNGAEPLTTLKINDFTPTYTRFSAAGCGSLAAGLTGCSVTQQPAAGTTGAVEWTFTGTLTPGASGTVTLNVTLE